MTMTLQSDGPKRLRLGIQATSDGQGKKRAYADRQYLSQLQSIFYSRFIITILQKYRPQKEISNQPQ